MVVGHPCSIRRGLTLQPDLSVAPIVEPGIPSAQHRRADRVLPVGKLIPPQSDVNRHVQLTRTTTVATRSLDVDHRRASLNRTGVVVLQQRVVGNEVRIKVPSSMIANHCRGPLTEIELWTDWRGAFDEAGQDPFAHDEEFDAFMLQSSGFEQLPWRKAIAEFEHARARAVSAMEHALADRLG